MTKLASKSGATFGTAGWIRACIRDLARPCDAEFDPRESALKFQAGDECGSSIVEFAISAAVYFSLFFGVVQLGMGVYTYNFVSEASREASRYAAVRGSQSCTISSTFPNCNLLPTSSGNPLKTYVQGLGYPGANSSNLSVTATWWEPTTNANGNKSWTTACTGATDASGNACNLEGNMVKVVVTDNYQLSIPFVPTMTLPVSAVSEMMINE